MEAARLHPPSSYETLTIQSLSPQRNQGLMSTSVRSRIDNQNSQYAISNWTPSTQGNAVTAKPIIKIKRHSPSPASNIVINDMGQARKSQFADWFSQDPLIGALDADMSLTAVSKKHMKLAKKYTTFAIEPSFMKKLARKK